MAPVSDSSTKVSDGVSNGGDAKAVVCVAVAGIEVDKVSGVDSMSGVDSICGIDNGADVTTETVSSSRKARDVDDVPVKMII